MLTLLWSIKVIYLWMLWFPFAVCLKFPHPFHICVLMLHCNLLVSTVLHAQFTTNRICAKNSTYIYVARTSNNRVIWWVTSNNACKPGEQLVVLANGSYKSDLYCCLLPKLCVLSAQALQSQHYGKMFGRTWWTNSGVNLICLINISKLCRHSEVFAVDQALHKWYV